MACCIASLIYHILYYTIIVGYPAYKIYQESKLDQREKIWVIYFLIIGVLTVLESTALIPIVWLLNKICGSLYLTIKALFALWLYYPEFRGALLLDQKFGKMIEAKFELLNPSVGKILTLFGIPKIETQGESKKSS